VALLGSIPLNIKKWHDMCHEMFVINAKVSGDVMMCRWGVAKTRTIGEKGLR